MITSLAEYKNLIVTNLIITKMLTELLPYKYQSRGLRSAMHHIIACNINNTTVTQQEIADKYGVSVVTTRNNIKMIMKSVPDDDKKKYMDELYVKSGGRLF